MNSDLFHALEKLYQMQITSRERLLTEILRVKLLLKELDNKPPTDPEQLFQLMKKTTEGDLGSFSADRDDFQKIFETLKDIDLLAFALAIFKDDRMGTVVSPKCLTAFISKKIEKTGPKKILITEAEKHLAGLEELLIKFSHFHFTLATQLKPMSLLLELAFDKYNNVQISFESIYTECLENRNFDYIYTLPSFGYRPEKLGKSFITRDSDGIAMENMLSHLTETGSLDIIVPAKITFAAMGFEKLRKYIIDNFHVQSIYILPEGTFRPATAIKTYLFTVTTKVRQCATIEIGSLELNRDMFVVADKKQILTEDFLATLDWRVELLLADDNEQIKKFRESPLAKVKLKDVAEVFRGKSILKKDLAPGKVWVLNISDIEAGEIDYSNLDTIGEEERKVKRYELLEGDVVLSCRGTAIKAAVFAEQGKTIIASANFLVIRPRGELIGDYIRIFLESPVGQAIIQSFQRGTTVMNINHADLMEMELPAISKPQQEEIINKYNQEQELYKTTIRKAETRWTQIKNSLYNKLL